MKLKDLELSRAKHAMRSKWEPKISRYGLSKTDCYTDGFWDGRLWAAARLLKLIPGDKRAAALALLEIAETERAEL
jgi:hypothetical protein